MQTPDALTLAAFQKYIAERYEATDRARGTPLTWMWFIEEVGELSHALARQANRDNIEEEFADVLAWLCTLANINNVDLAAAENLPHTQVDVTLAFLHERGIIDRRHRRNYPASDSVQLDAMIEWHALRHTNAAPPGDST